MTTNDKILNIYCDGGARGNPGPAASAFVVKDENCQIIHKQGHYLGIATNNRAEYQAVIEALKFLSTSHLVPSTVNFYLDSLLVVNQLNGKFKIKDKVLKNKYMEIKNITSHLALSTLHYCHIPRSQNSLADLLVNETLDNKA